MLFTLSHLKFQLRALFPSAHWVPSAAHKGKEIALEHGLRGARGARESPAGRCTPRKSVTLSRRGNAAAALHEICLNRREQRVTQFRSLNSSSGAGRRQHPASHPASEGKHKHGRKIRLLLRRLHFARMRRDVCFGKYIRIYMRERKSSKLMPANARFGCWREQKFAFLSAAALLPCQGAHHCDGEKKRNGKSDRRQLFLTAIEIFDNPARTFLAPFNVMAISVKFF